MLIRYRLFPEHTAALAGRFRSIEHQSSEVMSHLARQGLRINDYRTLTESDRLTAVAVHHYDTLLSGVRQFGPNPLHQEVALAEKQLQALLTSGRLNEIPPTISQLSDEVFWTIYSSMYNPLMRVGLAQTIFERHFGAVTGDHWLDVGAGTGIITTAGLRQGRHVVAIEPQASMRQYLLADTQAIRTGGVLTVLPGYFVPGMALDEQFDHVAMRYVMYFFDDYRAALSTVFEHLRVGGTVAVSNPLPKGAVGEEFQAFLQRRRSEIETLPLGWRLGIYDAVQARLANSSHLVDGSTIAAMMREIGFQVTHMELLEMDTALFLVGKKSHKRRLL